MKKVTAINIIIALFFIHLFLNINISYSQGIGVLKGKVMNSKDSIPIPWANVQIKGTALGSSTDQHGEFLFKNYAMDNIELIVSLIGFNRKTINTSIKANKITELRIYLDETAIPTEAVVITAGKHEQLLKEIPVSVSIVESNALLLRNIQTIDDALRYIPGVNMTEYQVNIRGSSGYSRGVGNRVLLLLDGLPLLSGDTGEMKFDVVTVSQIDRVEVVKGAGSTLYGSSALGGVINIITKEPNENANINLKLFSGFYDSPEYDEWKWSEKTRFYNGLDFNYSQQIGDFGIVFSAGLKNNDGYREADDSRKKNIFLKAKYNISQKSFLTLSSSYAIDDRGNYIVWKNVENALRYDPSITLPGERIFSTKFFFNSNYRYIINDNSFLNIKGNYYRTHFEDNIPSVNQNSTASTINIESQYLFLPFADNFFTIGICGSFNTVNSSIFKNREGYTAAGYVQDEYSLSEKTKISAGVRLDISKIEDLETDQSFTPKLGLSWQLSDFTTFRASLGGGFRTPSIGERFTSTSSGGIIIEPNPSILPERSWSYEIGGTQALFGSLFLDGSLFWNEYWDLIEPLVNPNTGKVTFQNITRARIYGAEINTKYEILSKLIHGEIGYTYIYPYDINDESVLKFRSKHILYLNNSLKIGNYSLECDYRFISKVEKIDELLSKIIKSSNVRVPIHVVDLRTSFDFSNVKLILNINNLFNYNYIEVVGNLAPIRNYSLTISYSP